MSSLDDLLDQNPLHDIDAQLHTIHQARKEHANTHPSATGFYTAVADTIAYRRDETTNPTTKQKLNELLYHLNIGIAHDFANRFYTVGDNRQEDYQQSAFYGLWQATIRYKPGMGSFSSWAYRHVRKAVSTSVRELEHHTLSQGAYEKRPKVLKAAEKLGPGASIDDIAAHAGTSTSLAARILNAYTVSSLDSALSVSDSDLTYHKLIASDDDPHRTVSRNMEARTIHAYLDTLLNDEQRHVLYHYYGMLGYEKMSYRELSDHLGKHREHSRRTLNDALATLRDAGLGERLDEYEK